MHMVISPGDINSYRVNKQGKYRTQSQVLQIFLTIKMPCSRKHAAAYTQENMLQPIQFLIQY